MLQRGKVFVDDSWFLGAAPLALEDGAVEALPMEDEEHLDTEDALHPLAAPDDAGLALAVVVAAPAPAANSWTIDNVQVHFDGRSHASRKLRAWVACKAPNHVACFKYRQVEGFAGGARECAAFLVEWLLQGHGCVDKEAHKVLVPNDESVGRRMASF